MSADDTAEELGFEHISDSVSLLPAWFIPRMMDDTWSFGLLTTAGVIIAIHCIDRVYQDANSGLWIDVELQEKSMILPDHIAKARIFVAPTSRTKASIQVSTIVAAFELADT
jgi:hypothetical protein